MTEVTGDVIDAIDDDDDEFAYCPGCNYERRLTGGNRMVPHRRFSRTRFNLYGPPLAMVICEGSGQRPLSD